MYEKFEKPIKKLTHIFQKRLSIKGCNAIICVSNQTKKDLLYYYPYASKIPIFVIYNGVDDAYYKLIRRPEIISFKDIYLQKDSFFLYVGSRGYCKNFSFALNLMKSYYVKKNNLKLVCVGGGAFAPDEITIMKELGILDKVIHFGSISSNFLNILYNIAKALIFPSLYEGFGIPLLEAARAHCVVLPSNSSSIPEVIGKSPFFYNPMDLSQLTEKLPLLDNPAVICEELNRAYQHSKKFSWETTSRMTIDVYEHILGINDN